MTKKVFCLGVWDMFHIGHLQLILAAAKLGDLTVGVVIDEAVREEKGPDRPVIPFWQRRMIVQSIKGVVDTAAVLFAIPENVLNDYDLIVIGADQNHITNLDKIPQEKRVNLPRTEGISTSDLIKKMEQK